jgi:hypothetical protein
MARAVRGSSKKKSDASRLLYDVLHIHILREVFLGYRVWDIDCKQESTSLRLTADLGFLEYVTSRDTTLYCHLRGDSADIQPAPERV